MNIRKSINDLTISDFEIFPIWSWEDDDDIVVPIITNENNFSGLDAIFVKCSIFLSSGVTFNGVLSVRVSDYEVFAISFPNKEGALLSLPIQTFLDEIRLSQLSNLCTMLNITEDKIFPIAYKASLKVSDRKELEGVINK
jgi:hypothetical protein